MSRDVPANLQLVRLKLSAAETRAEGTIILYVLKRFGIVEERLLERDERTGLHTEVHLRAS